MKTKLQLASLITGVILMVTGVSRANNLQIGTPTQPAANQIQFTISWSNAWNNSSGTPANWDAVWVFVKQQDCTTGPPSTWSHVTLTSTPSNNTVTGGSGNLQVDTASDGMGVFVRVTNASSPFAGSVSGTVTLTFASTPANTDNYKVFGIEMVYVPQGSYALGDGTGGTEDSYTAQTISSESAIANASTTLGYSYAGALNANYPKGYNAFYCMKYEITQHQWVDFLNTLTAAQQGTVMITSPTITAGNWAMGSSVGAVGYDRNSIKVSVSSVGGYPATYACDLGGTTAGSGPDGVYNGSYDGQDIACNYMSTQDLMYYLAWAALRPMTDMEFEKACRGSLGAVGGEYAWGTTALTAGQSYAGYNNNSSTQLLNTVSELPLNSSFTAATGNGLCVCGYTSATSQQNSTGVNGAWNNYGPMRVGAAATSSTSRVTAGATYWGILDMTGNVLERTIGTYTAAACGFGSTGTLHGIGTFAIPASWPNNGATSDFNARGGAWDTQTTGGICGTSGRLEYFQTSYAGRLQDAGGRGVRTHQ